MRTELIRRLEAARAWTDALLSASLPEAGVPPELLAAMRYALLGPGKRLRPCLVRMACEAHGGAPSAAENSAVAIEMVHTYSLVHDDLPCMDDDDLRRGRATCHKVYGEAMAVLVGDALLTEAFARLARERRAGELVAALARGAGAGGMVGGQVLDLGTEPGSCLARERVQAIHRAKTAALLGAAMELGALAADADLQAVQAARHYGLCLGEAFQAIDDILDVTAPTSALGKTAGKDQKHGKPTLVAALGLEAARVEAARLSAQAREAARALPGGEQGLFGVLAGHLLERQA
jgi:geranylgeranyl pyrophosphate synthase